MDSYQDLISGFLEVCEKHLQGDGVGVLRLVQKRFADCSPDYLSSTAFRDCLTETRNTIIDDEVRICVYLKDFLQELQKHKDEAGLDPGPKIHAASTSLLNKTERKPEARRNSQGVSPEDKAVWKQHGKHQERAGRPAEVKHKKRKNSESSGEDVCNGKPPKKVVITIVSEDSSDSDAGIGGRQVLAVDQAIKTEELEYLTQKGVDISDDLNKPCDPNKPAVHPTSTSGMSDSEEENSASRKTVRLKHFVDSDDSRRIKLETNTIGDGDKHRKYKNDTASVPGHDECVSEIADSVSMTTKKEEIDQTYSEVPRVNPRHINEELVIGGREGSSSGVAESKAQVKCDSLCNQREGLTEPLPGTSSDMVEQASDVPKKKGSQRQIKRLEKLMERLHNKIKRVQEKELNLDALDEETSSYIYEDKLKTKLIKVWQKLCELHDSDSTTGRPVQRFFKYEGTRYPDINKRITKFINRKKEFPDYHDISGLIMTVNREKNLGLKGRVIEDLARDAFTDVGNTLQQRRQQDFVGALDCHKVDLYGSFDDPALCDLELQKKLEANRKTGKTKMDAVLEKYSTLQLTKGCPESSDDSETGDEGQAESDAESSKGDNLIDSASQLLEGDNSYRSFQKGENCDGSGDEFEDNFDLSGNEDASLSPVRVEIDTDIVNMEDYLSSPLAEDGEEHYSFQVDNEGSPRLVVEETAAVDEEDQDSDMEGSLDGIEVVGSQDGIEVVGSQGGIEVVGSQDGIKVVGSSDGIQVVGSPDGIEVVGSLDGIEFVGSPDGIGITGSSGVIEMEGTPGVIEMEGTHIDVESDREVLSCAVKVTNTPWSEDSSESESEESPSVLEIEESPRGASKPQSVHWTKDLKSSETSSSYEVEPSPQEVDIMFSDSDDDLPEITFSSPNKRLNRRSNILPPSASQTGIPRACLFPRQQVVEDTVTHSSITICEEDQEENKLQLLVQKTSKVVKTETKPWDGYDENRGIIETYVEPDSTVDILGNGSATSNSQPIVILSDSD